MYKKFCLFFCFCINILHAQELKQILVLNEGRYDYIAGKIDKPVTVGLIDLVSNQYSQLFEIPEARFASDIQIDGGVLWVAADKYVNKYNLSTGELLASLTLVGVRRLAFFENLLIVTRGEYLQPLDSYIQIYDKHTLSLVASVASSDLPYTCESIQVVDGKAYIGVNNGFVFGGEVGEIAVVDLKSLKLVQRIDLGPDGKNPENLMLDNNVLYSLNNKDYKSSSISVVDLSAGSNVVTHNLDGVSSFCGTSALIPESIVYQELGKTWIGKFNLQTQTSQFAIDVKKSFYGLRYEKERNWIVASETDFVSFGKVYIYDLDWNELNNFNVGVSPGNFEFVYDQTIAVENWRSNPISAYPNPARNRIVFSTTLKEVCLIDHCGRKWHTGTQTSSIDTGEIPSGFYFLQYRTDEGTGVLKVQVLR